MISQCNIVFESGLSMKSHCQLCAVGRKIETQTLPPIPVSTILPYKKQREKSLGYGTDKPPTSVILTGPKREDAHVNVGYENWW